MQYFCGHYEITHCHVKNHHFFLFKIHNNCILQQLQKLTHIMNRDRIKKIDGEEKASKKALSMIINYHLFLWYDYMQSIFLFFFFICESDKFETDFQLCQEREMHVRLSITAMRKKCERCGTLLHNFLKYTENGDDFGKKITEINFLKMSIKG